MTAHRPRLLEGPVGKSLLHLAVPMGFGIAAVMLFSVVDVFFIGLLGPDALAAVSFTFPVPMLVSHLAMGIGIGAMAVISRAIGEGAQRRVRLLTTDALILGNTVVVVLAIAGLLTIDPVFALLGAGPDQVELIRQYMVPWYLGVGFLVIPWVGNSAIRATGDAKSSMLIMLLAGGVNMVLDPLLIFGLGPFPRWKLQGAAVATVLAWVAAFVAALWILARRERMLCTLCTDGAPGFDGSRAG